MYIKTYILSYIIVGKLIHYINQYITIYLVQENPFFLNKKG